MTTYMNKLSVLRTHQVYRLATWPQMSEPSYVAHVQKIFRDAGLRPDADEGPSPNACSATSIQTLRFHQRIVGLYLAYSHARGVIVDHSMGSGKTCTAINAIDQFLSYGMIEEETGNDGDPIANVRGLKSVKSVKLVKPATSATKDASAPVYFVIPPRANLRQNMRDQLEKCLGRVRDMVMQTMQASGDDRARGEAQATRWINSQIFVVSYVVLARRLREGKLSLEGKFLVLDEAPQFPGTAHAVQERLRQFA